MKNKEASSIGIIGEPDGNTAQLLEEHIGKTVRIKKKRDKTILIIGQGLFKKRLILPVKIK